VRVALVSPLPPSPTGVAEYTVRLRQALELGAAAAGGGFVFEAVDASSLGPAGAFDARIYQIGNNSLHAAAYRAALAAPGIVVLHDAVLHHLLLGLLSEREYAEEFVFNYGGWYRDIAADLWRDRGHAMADDRYFRYPLLRRIAEASRALIVHNPKAARWAREALRNSARQIPVVEIPHYVEVPELPPAAEVAARRAELGIPDGALVIACFGYMRPPKRLHSLREALRRVDAPCRVLIVGEFVAPGYEGSLEGLFADPRVIRLPYVPEQEFWKLAALTDVCVNLRHPSVGETSGVAMKMMAAGKTVLVTASEECSRLPELAVIRIDSGEAEVEMLAHYLYALATDAGMRALIGGNAAAYVREHHALERVAAGYLEVIRGLGTG
jgi:glycosyltransferase involved in cell wall biosynthesis